MDNEPIATGPMATTNRLNDQIAWYDAKSASNQRWYKSVKVLEIVAAAVIPLSIVFETPTGVAAVLGVVIVVAEGVQHVFQYHHNWITYRSTAEALKHEKYLYAASAGPYVDPQTADILLAERVESLVSQEHSKWVSTRKWAGRGGPKTAD